jgi:hypothetical protein
MIQLVRYLGRCKVYVMIRALRGAFFICHPVMLSLAWPWTHELPIFLGRNVDNVDPLWGFHGDNIPFYIHIPLDYGEYFSSIRIWKSEDSPPFWRHGDEQRNQSWLIFLVVLWFHSNFEHSFEGYRWCQNYKTKWGVQKYGKIPYLRTPPDPESARIRMLFYNYFCLFYIYFVLFYNFWHLHDIYCTFVYNT